MRNITPNMLWVCLDACDQTNMKGDVYHVLHETCMHFEDFNQMILQADALFDKIGYPQAFQQKRSMKEQERVPYEYQQRTPMKTTEEIIKHQGKCKTYVIFVSTRQFTSWQGTIFTKDFQVVGQFKDVLDLMHFIVAR